MKMVRLKLVKVKQVRQASSFSTPPRSGAVSSSTPPREKLALAKCACLSSKLEAAFVKAETSSWSSSVLKAVVGSKRRSSVAKGLLSSW